MTKEAKIERALSVRQPYAEQIMLGEKVWEYRSKPCNIRERVYIYASLKPAKLDPKEIKKEWKRAGANEGELPTGVIVGSVEIVDCKPNGAGFKWKLANPKRCRHRKPSLHPQAVFFRPF